MSGPTVGRELRPKALAALLREPATQLHLAHATSASGVARMVSTAWLAEHHLLCLLADSPAAKKAAAEKEAAKPPPEAQGLPSKDARTSRTFVGAGVSEPRPKARCVSRKMSGVKPESVDYLWPGRLPKGRIAIVMGRQGQGKSTFVSWLASVVSSGQPWPGSETPNAPGSVVWLQGEEIASQDVRPRLDANGANSDKIHVVDAVRYGDDGNELAVSLGRDIDAVESLMDDLGDCKLMIVDPIGDYLGGTNTRSDVEVRAVLDPLKKLAERRGLSIVLVMHPTKNQDKDVLDRVGNSAAFTQVARVSWYLSDDPTRKGRKLLSLMKGNPAGIVKTALAVSLSKTGRLVFGPKAVRLDAFEVDRLLQFAAMDEKINGRRGPVGETTNAARRWIVEFLEAKGPAWSSSVFDQSSAAGFGESTYRKALKRLIEDVREVEQFDGPEGRRWLRASCPLVLRNPVAVQAPEGDAEAPR